MVRAAFLNDGLSARSVVTTTPRVMARARFPVVVRSPRKYAMMAESSGAM